MELISKRMWLIIIAAGAMFIFAVVVAVKEQIKWNEWAAMHCQQTKFVKGRTYSSYGTDGEFRTITESDQTTYLQVRRWKGIRSMNNSDLLDLDAIEKRATAATVGPWKKRPVIGSVGLIASGGRIVAKIWYAAQQNADFISHAREDVPALVIESRNLRKEISDIEDRTIDELEKFDIHGLCELIENARSIAKLKQRELNMVGGCSCFQGAAPCSFCTDGGNAEIP